jgi:hypothetical protein
MNILSRTSLDRPTTDLDQSHQLEAQSKYRNFKDAVGARTGIDSAPNFKPRPRPEMFHLDRSTPASMSLLEQLSDDPIMSSNFTGKKAKLRSLIYLHALVYKNCVCRPIRLSVYGISF